MNTEDRKELKSFIDRYKEIETSIELMQKSIESLAEKRDALFDELRVLRKRKKLL